MKTADRRCGAFSWHLESILRALTKILLSFTADKTNYFLTIINCQRREIDIKFIYSENGHCVLQYSAIFNKMFFVFSIGLRRSSSPNLDIHVY